MAIWSVAGNVTTLTLDGSETGPFSRSHTFTAVDGIEASELHTFYLVVNTNAVAVRAFLEVVGGDVTEATVTGAHTLVARGDADGSANITVRFGVLDAGGAPSSSSTIEIQDYANQAAAEADGISFFNLATPPTGSSFAFHDPTPVGPIPFGFTIVAPNNGYYVQSGEMYVDIPIVVVDGQTYTIKCWLDGANTNAWYNNGSIHAISGANSDSGNGGINGGNQVAIQRTITITADGTAMTIRLRGNPSHVGHNPEYWRFAHIEISGVAGAGAEIDFSDLEFCVGSGLGDGGTGNGGGEGEGGGEGGSPGTEPTPPPPPGVGLPGQRPFGIFKINAGGLGAFDCTVKQTNPRIAVDLLRQARAAGTSLILQFGSDVNWMSGGRFQLPLWKQSVDNHYNDARCRVEIDASIADGSLFGVMAIDEPYQQDRYGVEISLATTEAMCLYLKSKWPEMRVIVHVNPRTVPWWFTRHINGMDACWGEYTLRGGDTRVWRDANIAATVAVNHQIILCIHYRAFGTNPKDWTRYATAAEIRHHLGIIVTPPTSGPNIGYKIVGSVGWAWSAGFYAQPDVPEAVRDTRILMKSYD